MEWVNRQQAQRDAAKDGASAGGAMEDDDEGMRLFSNMKDGKLDQLPEQFNSYDCGLFMLRYIQRWAEELPDFETPARPKWKDARKGPEWNFTATDIEHYRKHMLENINALSEGFKKRQAAKAKAKAEKEAQARPAKAPKAEAPCAAATSGHEGSGSRTGGTERPPVEREGREVERPAAERPAAERPAAERKRPVERGAAQQDAINLSPEDSRRSQGPDPDMQRRGEARQVRRDGAHNYLQPVEEGGEEETVEGAASSERRRASGHFSNNPPSRIGSAADMTTGMKDLN